MKEFTYVVKDELGIHARPAGLIVKKAKEFTSKITISANGKSADACRLMAIMGMCIKQGSQVHVSVEGEDEADACAVMQELFESSL